MCCPLRSVSTFLAFSSAPETGILPAHCRQPRLGGCEALCARWLDFPKAVLQRADIFAWPNQGKLAPLLPDVSGRLTRRKSRNNCPYRMRTETQLLHIAHQFLLEMRRDARAFTKDDFRRAINSDEMFERHWPSGFVHLLVKVDGVIPERFVVGSAFGGCMGRDEFERRILGMQREDIQYSMVTHLKVINYEFFMPVAHEENLKLVLDSLFFKDDVLKRIEALGLSEVQCHFPKLESENDADYLERLFGWLGDKFGGFSMSKVNGRFRMKPLKPKLEALEAALQRGEAYLVDEETVVVRFIFKCGKLAAGRCAGYDVRCELHSDKDDFDTKRDAYLVQYFFWKLFVESIIKAVNGEAEIWLVESGMRSCLHIWSKTPGSTISSSKAIDRPWYLPAWLYPVGARGEAANPSP